MKKQCKSILKKQNKLAGILRRNKSITNLNDTVKEPSIVQKESFATLKQCEGGDGASSGGLTSTILAPSRTSGLPEGLAKRETQRELLRDQEMSTRNTGL